MKNRDFLKNLNIVYVDDDAKNTEKLKELLQNFFREVYIFNSPTEFLESMKTANYDLLMFDICMPEYSGTELVKIVRKENKKVPIILLTAYMNEDNLFESVNLNIQSYITKPLNFEKLFRAIESVLDFLDITNSLGYEIDGFKFDKNSLKLSKDGKEILLNKKERSLLELLVLNVNTPVSYEQIENKIWNLNDELMTQNALRTVIKTLRKKLEETALLKNISGYGYVLASK